MVGTEAGVTGPLCCCLQCQQTDSESHAVLRLRWEKDVKDSRLSSSLSSLPLSASAATIGYTSFIWRTSPRTPSSNTWSTLTKETWLLSQKEKRSATLFFSPSPPALLG